MSYIQGLNRTTQELSEVMKVSKIYEIGAENDIMNFRMDLGMIIRDQSECHRRPEEHNSTIRD